VDYIQILLQLFDKGLVSKEVVAKNSFNLEIVKKGV